MEQTDRTPRGMLAAAALTLAVLMAPDGAARAAEAASLPSIEDFARSAEFGSISFSPDASRFAALVERDGQMVLAVVEYPSNKGRIFRTDHGTGVRSFRWLSNDLIRVRTTKEGVRQFDLSWADFQTVYVSLDGKRPLATVLDALRLVPGSQTDLIVSAPTQTSTRELQIVDSTSGAIKRVLTGDPPGPSIREWVLDQKLVPRAAVGYDNRTHKVEVWWRDSADAKWTRLTTYDPRAERGYYPVAMDADDNLLVLSNLATGRFALHKFDRQRGQPGELLVGHPLFDIDEAGLIESSNSLVLVGVSIDAEKQQTYWFDSKRDAVQRLIDASLPAGNVNQVRFLSNGKVLVHTYSDVDPGAYYFYDPAEKTLAEWTRARPWINPQRMARTEVVHYKARDGLEIQGYLTVPAKAPPSGHPLLVWVHGGPFERDSWGFDPMVQFIASRGYAVFQPNFRGSTGFGDQFEAAGFRQWGLRMQDDVTDGIRMLIEGGRVDRTRICIGGASYGGYAALMGLVREPDLFRCAIDEAGPTDLAEMINSPVADYNRRTGTHLDQEREESLRRRIGDVDSADGRKVLEANSPVRQAARIKSPVLLLYGTEDHRVPLSHGTTMRDALRAAGVPHEWKSYAGEGHGIWDRANQVDLLGRIERFLAKHIGPDAAP